MWPPRHTITLPGEAPACFSNLLSYTELRTSQPCWTEMPVKAGSTQGSTLSPAGLKGKAVKPVIPICSSLGTCFSLLWSIFIYLGFPGGPVGKESACNAGDPGSIPGSGRSPGEGKGYPLQYSGLKNSMDYTVHEATKCQTRLSNFHFI